MINQTVWYVLGVVWLLCGLWWSRFVILHTEPPLWRRAAAFLFYIFFAAAGPMATVEERVESFLRARKVSRVPFRFFKDLANMLSLLTGALIFWGVVWNEFRNEVSNDAVRWVFYSIITSILVASLGAFVEYRKMKLGGSASH